MRTSFLMFFAGCTGQFVPPEVQPEPAPPPAVERPIPEPMSESIVTAEGPIEGHLLPRSDAVPLGDAVWVDLLVTNTGPTPLTLAPAVDWRVADTDDNVLCTGTTEATGGDVSPGDTHAELLFANAACEALFSVGSYRITAERKLAPDSTLRTAFSVRITAYSESSAASTLQRVARSLDAATARPAEVAYAQWACGSLLCDCPPLGDTEPALWVRAIKASLPKGAPCEAAAP